MNNLSQPYAKRRLAAFGLASALFLILPLIAALVLVGTSGAPAQAALNPNNLPAGVSRVGNGAARAAGAAGPGMYDDTDPHFAYSGVWYQGNIYPDAYKSTMHFSNDPKARATFTFQGTGFALYRVTYINRGLMEVYVDGALIQNANNFSDKPAWQVPLAINGLADAVHSVEFRNTSNKFYIDIDAIQILRGAQAAPSPTPVRAGKPTLPPPPIIQPLAPSNTPTQPVVPPTPGQYKQIVYGGSDLAVVVSNLYTVDPVTSDTPVPMTNTGAAPGFSAPVWSPDGKKVAFINDQGVLEILDTTTGTFGLPGGAAVSPASPISWDPSGANRIAFVDSFGVGALSILDFTGAAIVTALVAPASASQISWKDAGAITFAQIAVSSSDPMLLNVDPTCVIGPACPVTPAIDAGALGATNFEPAWNQARTLLAYVSNRNGEGTNNDLYVYDPAANLTTQITFGGGTIKKSPTWGSGANANRIAYVEGTTALKVIDLTIALPLVTPGAIITVRTPTGSITSASWSKNPLPPFTPTPVPSATSTPTATLTPSTIPTATPSPSATVTLTPAASPVPPTATLTVNNTSPNVGATVTFTMTLNNPAGGATLTNVTPCLMISGHPQTCLPAVPSVAPNSSTPFQFTYQVQQGDSCNLTPVGSIAWSAPNNPPSPITVAYTGGSPIIVQELLTPTIASSSSPASGTTVFFGQTVTSTLTITNTGCLPITFTVNRPGSSDPISYLGSQTVSPGGSLTVNSTHTVVSGDPNPLTIFFNVSGTGTAAGGTPGALTVGPIASQLESFPVSSATLTPGPGTGTATGGFTLTITKTASAASASPGKDITFTITVTNTSTSAIPNVSVTDNVPSDTMTVKNAASDVGAATASGNSVTAALGTLTPGQAAHITITATILASVKSPTVITNAATVQFAGGSPISASVNVPLATGGAVLPTTGSGGSDLDSLTTVLLAVGVMMVCGVAFGFYMKARARH